MGKYDQNIYLKRTKARTSHGCDMCYGIIELGEYYYAETQKDKFLHSLNAKRFCTKCYEKYGERLLSIKGKKKPCTKQISFVGEFPIMKERAHASSP